MHVTKMHGARNDFVLVDGRAQPVSDPPALARWICDRHAGIGADGLIVLEHPFVGDVRMRILNADGSEAEMCGNGIRCAARWLDEAGGAKAVAFETQAGIVRTEIVESEPIYSVRVSMGSPHLALGPQSHPASMRVDLGNPHVVVLATDVDAVDLVATARELQNDPEFLNGTNVHVVALQRDGSIRVRHWERGVGLTQACGTGAVACAAVAIAKDLVASPVDVLVPGGRLVVEWDGKGEAVLTGPAERVFDAEVNGGVVALR